MMRKQGWHSRSPNPQIEKLKRSYGRKIAKLILSIPSKDQFGARMEAEDVSYEVIMELTRQSR